MMSLPVVAILDVGKTNKKLIVFDDRYQLLYEESVQLEETVDEDGFPCEDVHVLTTWVKQKFSEVLQRKEFDARAVNFSGYGASLVYAGIKGDVIAPLYSYLKPYPEQLKKDFYHKYGGETVISKETASPSLGSLNSGLQLYRIKYEQPGLFDRMAYAFHLPQFLSYIIADFPVSEITSIGCHTLLWNYRKKTYHSWVEAEQLNLRFPFIMPASSTIPTKFQNREIEIGIGMHDSSAALIPYLFSFHEPFVLISTGTWCISLNPFNHSKLTAAELLKDCLCYLSYNGTPVKASRLFAGQEHDLQVKRLSEHFNKTSNYNLEVIFDLALWDLISQSDREKMQRPFSSIDLDEFESYEIAYHRLMSGIIEQQVSSTNLVLKGTGVKRIFVDGGFGKNAVYMHLLALAFPDVEVYAATIAQASAIGAAMVIHNSWNQQSMPSDIIELKYYSNTKNNNLV